MIKRAKPQVEVGDRFVKSDDPRTIWVVAGKGSAVAPTPHVKVVQEGQTSRMRTLAESVLLDTDFYRRVSE